MIRLCDITAYNCPEPPLELPDCWRERDAWAEPEEPEYDRVEDELNGKFNRY